MSTLRMHPIYIQDQEHIHPTDANRRVVVRDRTLKVWDRVLGLLDYNPVELCLLVLHALAMV